MKLLEQSKRLLQLVLDSLNILRTYLFEFLYLIRPDEIAALVPHLFLQPLGKLLQDLNIKLLDFLGVIKVDLIIVVGTTLHLYSNNNQYYINLFKNISFYIDPSLYMAGARYQQYITLLLK